MKKLTGRAAEDFKGWLFSTRNEIIKVGVMEYDLYYMFMYMLPETCQNALIIQWLDTIKYKGNPLFELCFEIYWKLKPDWMSFENVCGQAVEKANELYNLNNLGL